MSEKQVNANGLFFSVSLTAAISLDEAAPAISRALGVPLALSEERGTRGDYEADVLGLHLWLFVADQPTSDSPLRLALLGGPDHDLDPNASWLDIGDYVAELLSKSTGLNWVARHA